MIYKGFSQKQLTAMTWWNRPQLKACDGILCDGAIRSGKTVSMTVGFFLWSMATYEDQVFGICGKTIGALRRNLIIHLADWLGDTFCVTEHRSENRLTVRCGRKRTPITSSAVRTKPATHSSKASPWRELCWMRRR